MLEQFREFTEKEKLFGKKDKILLTISGGIDSVVMHELFHLAKLNFGVAHCNFKLRGEESEEDELFVRALAEKHGSTFHCTSFSTENYSKENALSIQMAARELRYDWFEKIRKEYKYKYIAVAHHKDDSVETFFINLIRGTGISGLHGILPKQNHIVRPMLFSTKKEIEVFAQKNKILFREDSSNRSDKYLRNKIRHNIIPVLKNINPNIEEVISGDINRIRDVEQIYHQEIDRRRKEILKVKGLQVFISIKKLRTLDPLKTYLFEFLKEYDFNGDVVKSIIEVLDTNSGKQFFSSTHRLVKDREDLIITKREQLSESFHVNYTLKDRKEFNIPSNKEMACLDHGLLKLPLKIRKWKNGDFFYPLGMNQKKKISDFLIDNKVSIPDKENLYVLTSGQDIVWVIGMRVDERFKVTEKTKKVYVCELVERSQRSTNPDSYRDEPTN